MYNAYATSSLRHNIIQSGFWLVPSWIYGAEITPLAIRQRSNSLGIATQFLWNFGVVMVTPVAIARIGGYY